MTGMDRNTGQPIDGLARILQDIHTVLTTPLGACVMRREYGSLISTLLDKPLNAATRLLVGAAAAAAINRWVSGVKLTRAVLSGGDATGAASVELTGYRTDLPSPQPFSASISLR